MTNSMQVTRGYKTELDLNKKQRTLCLPHVGVARWAYNFGLARKQEAMVLRKHGEKSWLAEVSKCAPQQVSERPVAITLKDLNTLAQAIADGGMGELRRQMTYTSRWYGNELYLAHPFSPSTQLCSGCHRLPAIRIDLSIRTYHCEQCSLVIDRDRNAALHLKWLYTASSAELNACGKMVRPDVLALTAVLLKQEPSAT